MEPLIGLDFVNFQSLEKTEINLDPGLNVIVGPSNLGKSAAIRGLKSLVYNAPATGLVREGAKQFDITAWFADGQRVGLTKGKSKSEFYWNDALYAKSGATDVPNVIASQWAIAENKLSFAAQHDAPFLLAEPASAVAKVIGDLTNASMLAEAVQACNKKRTAANNDVKAREREAEEAHTEILAHAGLSARGKALEAARKAYSATQTLAQEWATLVQLQEKHTALISENNELTLLTESSVNLSTLIAQADEAVAQLTALQDLQKRHRTLSSDFVAADMQIGFMQDNIARNEIQIQELLEQAGVCPVCNQEVH